MVATAKLHGVEPLAYLKDVLSRIADYPISRVAELLPQNWKPPSES
ncbi:MAG: transposase domain-containing protein [candidate division KSB1 bacterium]|nr:transposase domain-containing protein [candidate division KSB1 bacterium]